MNKKELDWLLQTIKDPATAERFFWRSTSAAEFRFT